MKKMPKFDVHLTKLLKFLQDLIIARPSMGLHTWNPLSPSTHVKSK